MPEQDVKFDLTRLASSGTGKDAISLEELQEQVKEKQKAANKPKFQTRKDRERAALKRKEEEGRKRKREMELGLEEARRQSKKARQLEKEQGVKADTIVEKEGLGQPNFDEKKKQMCTMATPASSVQKTGLSMDELEDIKKKYLGKEKPKKWMPKPNEKVRFDWEPEEDTSRDPNKLFDKPIEAQLLFGRGFRGGMDTSEQLDKQIVYENLAANRERAKQKQAEAAAKSVSR